MARILTGIQASGIPHLGNVLGAIAPGIELSKDSKNECFFFIADFHSLTTVHEPEMLRHNTYATAAAWIACGFDTSKGYFYRQSDIPEVAELTWYLNCFTPFPMLANAHSFKDKSGRLQDVNAGLFDYPVLMASDILLYDAEIVPVGKDQLQHLEITRDICSSFNRAYGETLIMPQAVSRKEVQMIPGTDGQKMSKSYGNTISIFDPEKLLKKTVMSIQTDSLPLETPKNPDTCTVYRIYSAMGNENQNQVLAEKYRGGNFGYGAAKQMLFELIMERYSAARDLFGKLMADQDELDELLRTGAEKAGVIAYETLARVREKIGYNKFAYYSSKI